MDYNSNVEQVLGVFWVPNTDVITLRATEDFLKSQIIMSKRRPLKREVLRMLMSIND